MARKYLFIDESGNLDFSGKATASGHFILTSVTSSTYEPSIALLRHRHDLVIDGDYDGHCFHATEDKQQIRDGVFSLIRDFDIEIDSTIFEKRKAFDRLKEASRFYNLAWHMHLKHVIPRVAEPDDDLIIFAATITVREKRQTFEQTLKGTVEALGNRRGKTKVVFWPAQCDHGIQIADYCAWAIQRKWERGDTRSYELIEHLIMSEFDIFRRSK